METDGDKHLYHGGDDSDGDHWPILFGRSFTFPGCVASGAPSKVKSTLGEDKGRHVCHDHSIIEHLVDITITIERTIK